MCSLFFYFLSFFQCAACHDRNLILSQQCSQPSCFTSELAKLLPKLKTLSINTCSYLTSRCLNQIASSAAKLTELHIGYNNRLNEASFQHLFCSGPPLRKLVVSSNRDVFSHVDRLAESLQFLRVNEYGPSKGMLGHQSMQAIGRLVNLKSLVIYGGENSMPQDFFNMVARGQLLKLRILHLKRAFVTSENVEIVMMKCLELQELRLINNSAVSFDFARVVSTSLQILHINNAR